MSERAATLAEDVLKLPPAEKLYLAASLVDVSPSTAAAIAQRAIEDLTLLQLLTQPSRGSA